MAMKTKKAPPRKAAPRKKAVRRRKAKKPESTIEKIENAILAGVAEADEIALDMGLLAASPPPPKRRKKRRK